MTTTKKPLSVKTIARNEARAAMAKLPAHLQGLSLAAGDSAAYAVAKAQGLELAYSVLRDRAQYHTLMLVAGVFLPTCEWTKPTSLRGLEAFALQCTEQSAVQCADAAVPSSKKMRGKRFTGMVQAALANAYGAIAERAAAKLDAAANAPAKQTA